MSLTAPSPRAGHDPVREAIVDIETRLAAMQRALLAGDAPTIDAEAYGLQRALAACAPLLPKARAASEVPDSTRAMLASVRARTEVQALRIEGGSVAGLQTGMPSIAVVPGGAYTFSGRRRPSIQLVIR